MCYKISLKFCFIFQKFYDFIMHDAQIYICYLNIELTRFDPIISQIIIKSNLSLKNDPIITKIKLSLNPIKPVLTHPL